MTEEELPFCECGKCGLGVTKPGNRFINGHNRRGKKNSPKHCANLSKANKNSEAVKAVAYARRGIPLSPGHCESITKGREESDAVKANADRMRGGNDLVNHHYIYDHANPELYTMKVTRAKHTQIHNWMRKAGIVVPHINEDVGE